MDWSWGEASVCLFDFDAVDVDAFAYEVYFGDFSFYSAVVSPCDFHGVSLSESEASCVVFFAEFLAEWCCDVFTFDVAWSVGSVFALFAWLYAFLPCLYVVFFHCVI